MKFCFKTFAMAAFAMVTLASCSDEEKNAGVSTPSDNSIQFSTYVGTSRGTVMDITSLQGLAEGFGVYASYTAGKNWSDSDQSANYMYNQQVGWSGFEWTYSPLKYWPNQQGEKVSFLAYAPYQSSVITDPTQSGITAFQINNGANGVTGMKLAYQVGTDVLGHKDLVFAQAFDQSSSNSTVNLKFRHALAKVGFKVYGWEKTKDPNTTVTINGISLSNTLNAASLNLAEGKMEFAGETGDTYGYILKGDLLQNTEINGGDEQGKQLNTDEAYIMALPDFAFTGKSDCYCVVVDYTVTTFDSSLADGKVEIRNKVYRKFRPGFESGKAYTIGIHLGLDGGSGGGDDDDPDDPDPVDPNPGNGGEPTPGGDGGYVKFSATVSDWDDASSETTVNMFD
ncbi:MAG: fimbrillin family protein [Bacteroidales bacterium]|nr:fimbrillin family protein [Bacteroidales bacterium]